MSGTVEASDAAIWHDLECGAYEADLELWRDLAHEAVNPPGGPCSVLDLGCGTGRVSLPLAEDGCRVTALDVDAELLASLSARAQAAGAAIETVAADARSFELGSRFELVLAPMQLVQLMRSARERRSLLTCIARHLDRDGLAALALLELEEQWDSAGGGAPLPDMREIDGRLYSSQPVAVRRVKEGRALELDRTRRVVSSSGALSETFSRVTLDLVSPAELCAEARDAGLAEHATKYVPATDLHMASTVVVLRADA